MDAHVLPAVFGGCVLQDVHQHAAMEATETAVTVHPRLLLNHAVHAQFVCHGCLAILAGKKYIKV